jgi:hypothetical protein
MLQVNVMSLTELTYVFGRDMVQRGGGHILLLASLLGYQAVPGTPPILQPRLTFCCSQKGCIRNWSLTARQ